VRRFVLIACLFCVSAVHAADSSAGAFICAAVRDAGEHMECLRRSELIAARAADHSTRDIAGALHLLWPVGFAVYCMLGLIIARYIYRDAANRDWAFLGIRPIWWAALAVLNPAMGILVYWATHYSRLVQSYAEAVGPGSIPEDDV
jgi:hypothetical protein